MNDEGHRRRRSAITWTVLSATVVPVVAHVMGVPAALAVLMAVSIAAVGGISTLFEVSRNVVWSDANVILRAGARTEVSRLSWSMPSRYGRVSEAAVHRLRAIAASRLALRGIDLDDPAQAPAAEAALGASAYRVLESPSEQFVDTLLRCVHAIDALDGADALDSLDSLDSLDALDAVNDQTRRPA